MRDITTLFKDSLALMQSKRSLILGVLVVPVLFTILVALFAPSPETGVIHVPTWSVYLLLSLASAIINIFLSLALILVLDGRAHTAKEAYNAAGTFFLKYLGLSILQGIMLTIAFLLLIVPGIILSVWLAVSVFVLVLEGTGIVAAMKQSREYVRGHWMEVALRLLALAFALLIVTIVLSGIFHMVLPVVIGNVVATVLSMLLVPFGLGYVYLMYQDLRGRGPVVVSETVVIES